MPLVLSPWSQISTALAKPPLCLASTQASDEDLLNSHWLSLWPRTYKKFSKTSEEVLCLSRKQTAVDGNVKQIQKMQGHALGSTACS